MITFAVLVAHTVLDILFGWSLLSHFRHNRNWAETALVSLLVGLYADTLIGASAIFAGASLVAATSTTAAVMMVAIAIAIYRNWPLRLRPLLTDRLKWYEWLLAVTVCEKLLFAVWQLTRTHTYFDDALQHWSGRARSLYGAVNWSMDPASPFFLADHIGQTDYPLLTIMWRATSAKLNGGWNEIISRADGVLFFIAVVATVWLAVWRFSGSRRAAAAAAFVVSALPLHAWHAAAGYSDIAVEAFVAASIAALLRDEWVIAGVLAAGAVWSKNEGLLLFFPALFAGAAVISRRKIGLFLAGFATITPWLLFNFAHHLGVTSGQGGYAWHSDAPALLAQRIFWSTTCGSLWIGVFAALAYAGTGLFKDKAGRGLIVAFLLILAAMFFVFTSSSAYRYLQDEETIYRSLMQFSAMAVVISSYGLWLKSHAIGRPVKPGRLGR